MLPPSHARCEDIPPPFGFRWNDPAAKVEQVLVAAKAKIVSRDKRKSEVWTVEGLVQPGLKRTLLLSRKGFLVEVELQYEYDKWIDRKLQQPDGRNPALLRRQIRHRQTHLTHARHGFRRHADIVGYQWMVGGTMLELFYFSAQRESNHLSAPSRSLTKRCDSPNARCVSFCSRFSRLARLAFVAELIRSINRMPLR